MKTDFISAENFRFLPGNTGIENVAALNAAVKQGGRISVSARGVYDIAGTVLLPSDTYLEFGDGVVLRRTPLEDDSPMGNLFINEGAYEGRYNENISIIGAHIVVNGVESASPSPENKNIIAGLRGHIAFLYIKNVIVRNITITDLCAKDYAIQISDFENALVEDIHIEGLKDGVHFGPGRGFTVRNGVFRTYDDAIALNASDYSVSNPNIGTISDGLIENCVDLPGDFTYSMFLRILVGTARKWEKGMTVYHSDAILTSGGMYRVIMRPDNTPYISETEPCFDGTYQVIDGILWAKTHKGYAREDIPLTAGCRNIVCRNIYLEQPRDRAVLIYASFDEYLRSYYSGSEVPEVSNISFEGVSVLKPTKTFLHIITETENIRLIDCTLGDARVIVEQNEQMKK